MVEESVGQHLAYHKLPKYSDTQIIAIIILKFEQCGSSIYRVMSLKNADGMANSVDPDQTAPLELEAVWSGSALFASALRSLWCM